MIMKYDCDPFAITALKRGTVLGNKTPYEIAGMLLEITLLVGHHVLVELILLVEWLYSTVINIMLDAELWV